jgi:uncharacterized protein YbcI
MSVPPAGEGDAREDVGVMQQVKHDEGELSGAARSDVSTGLVQLYRRFYGRGPTRAKTVYEGDVLTTVLADIFTTVEQTLVDRGHADLVTGVRHAFQEAMRHEFIATVEANTGRTVESFCSGVDVEHAVATETFVFLPLADGHSEETAIRQADPALRRRVRIDAHETREDARALSAQARQATRPGAGGDAPAS